MMLPIRLELDGVEDMVGRLKGTNSTDVEGEGHLAWEIASPWQVGSGIVFSSRIWKHRLDK